MSTQLALADVRLDGGTQSRASTNEDTVALYADNLDKLPAIEVKFDGAHYWLADGFHRYLAHQRMSCAFINAIVTPGTARDAFLRGIEVNSRHGLRYSNPEKRANVLRLVTDPEWSRNSDRHIAKLCGVGHPLVASLRPQVESDSTSGPPANPPTRTGADGKQYPATRKPPVVALVPPLAPRPDAAATAREIFDDLPAASEPGSAPDEPDEWDEIAAVGAVEAAIQRAWESWPAGVSTRALELSLRFWAGDLETRRKGAA